MEVNAVVGTTRWKLKGRRMSRRTRLHFAYLGILKEELLVVAMEEVGNVCKFGLSQDPSRDHVQIGRVEIVSW
jgi:hypothetical protein